MLYNTTLYSIKGQRDITVINIDQDEIASYPINSNEVFKGLLTSIIFDPSNDEILAVGVFEEDTYMNTNKHILYYQNNHNYDYVNDFLKHDRRNIYTKLSQIDGNFWDDIFDYYYEYFHIELEQECDDLLSE